MNFEQAIERATHLLSITGRRVETKTIQGMPSPTPMWEAINVSIRAQMPSLLEQAEVQIKPNTKWADEHFNERVGGVPLNPPPSHVNWPYAKDKNEKFRFDEAFSHSYPERFWPKHAGPHSNIINDKGHHGIRFYFGDLDNLISILKKDPNTRQAFLPIWFPEDLYAADKEGVRVPCSLGYQIVIREGFLHIIYFIRSCDYFRHLRDDIYLAYRLAAWVRAKVSPDNISLGTFTMHITSLHCFYPEKNKL